MLPSPMLAAVLLAAAPGPRWEVNGSAITATPAVLTQGLSLGAAAEATRRLRRGFLSARLGWSAASAANDAWIIDHHQFIAAVGLGASATLGAGRVWAQAGGGATGLYEILSRHQRARIDAAAVPGGAETSFNVGPFAFGELGVAVQMRGPLSGLLAAGPTVCRTRVDGAPLWRLGAAARLGVGYAF